MIKEPKPSAAIETGKVKLPSKDKTRYEYNHKDIFDIFNADEFPDFVFRWVIEQNFSDHKEKGWEFVDPAMGLKTRKGAENAFGRIQFKEFTLMFHWKDYMVNRDKVIRERAAQRVTNAKDLDYISQKIKDEEN